MSLVITRKVGESFFCKCSCGELIKTSVGKIDNNKVRLCIDASEETKIARSELIERSNATIDAFFSEF